MTDSTTNSTNSFRLETLGEGIARLVFDLAGEKVNKLTSTVLLELDQMLKQIADDSSIKIVLLTSGKQGSGTFIAGADIDEIDSITDTAEALEKVNQAHEIFGRLESLPQPVLAAVDGKCLGGGTELILACDFRIAADHEHTAIGLPEVNLGIIPGFGGTQRLPRLIGVQAGLQLILTGKTVDARKASKLGLVDRVAPMSLLEEAAVAFAREILEHDGKRSFLPRRKKKMMVKLLEDNGLGRKVIRSFARKDIMRRSKGHYPAPLKALEAVLSGYSMTLENGLRLERELVSELITSDISKHLIATFQASEKLRRGEKPEEDAASAAPAVDDGRSVSREIGVIGAGIMGGGIAALLARKGFRVRLKDIAPAAIATAYKEVAKSFKALVTRRRMTRSDADNALAAISATAGTPGSPVGLGQVSCVIEAIVEDMNLKKAVIKELEPHLPEDAIIASNTSSLCIDELAEAASRPERVAGLHFFNPVHRMPLVEVIIGAQTSEATVEGIESLSRKLGKFPLRVKNGPGFLVNRLLLPYLNEACYLFEEGNTLEGIDRAAVAFGMPLGPLALLDEVGLDVANKVANYLHEKFGDRARPANVLSQLAVDEKLLGKKGKAGYYQYEKGRRRGGNPTALKYSGQNAVQVHDSERLIQRIMLPMVNEAARCLEEDIITAAWQVDIAMIMGTGFPPFRGGPLKWADSLGLKKVCEGLEDLARQAGESGAVRFEPSAKLKKLAEAGTGFYEDG